MAVYQVGPYVPELAADAFVAEGAQVIGRVRLGPRASVWYGSVIRADNDLITIGRDSNIQDGCVLHADDGVPLTIGEGVLVGHQVMLHGCTIGDNTLIGIQSVILNRARIGRDSIVGGGGVMLPAAIVAFLNPHGRCADRNVSLHSLMTVRDSAR